MKITVFNGSPRGIESNSHRIVKPLLEGAAKAGANVQEIFLVDHNIQHCRGCFNCWDKTPGKCTINDDMTDMISLYLESEIIGLATPVYNMYMTGLLKNFTDRLLPLATPHIQVSEEGEFYHEGRVNSFPSQFMIANSGFPGDNNFKIIQALTSLQPMVLEVYRNCGELLAQPESDKYKKRVEDFYSELSKAGKELVNNGYVSDEIVENIHKELISDKDYMNLGNQYWDDELEKIKRGIDNEQ